ncbi:MAG TPA: transcriptional coactivator p15/PC4 family protein [Clostridia bacterium]
MADFWDKEELIGKISKNSKDEIQVKKVEKKGRKYVDIRVFWLEPASNEFKPSQKGVTIPEEGFEEFRKLIDSIE